MYVFSCRTVLFCLIIFLMSSVHIYSQERSNKMDLRSDSFENNGMIDAKYTCDGSDISPHLEWSNAPEGTKSFALACNDPDAPVGNFIHWLVYNIPADVTQISENGVFPTGTVNVITDFRRKGYGGPCPPSGTHRYYFTVYALDTVLENINNKLDFYSNVEEHTINKAVIMGKYSRKR